MGTAAHDITAAIAAERRELAALFGDLDPERWEAPSLCAGWRVREVVAHMSMGFRHSTPAVLWELAKAGGSINRMADRLARRDAAAHPDERLAAFLSEHAHHPWKPPVGGFETALAHDVVHGLDVTVALGLDRRVPEDRLSVVLGTVGPRTSRFFGADLDGVRLHADDLDWTYGTGAPLHGTAQDLLLVAYGRCLPPGRLTGEVCHRFVAG
ncbi:MULTISPECIES: maleylpyruvate isomerase family mycothiol-dependent enzyme [Streptomyces]|uniref:Maleylpyruvate isomerase family mycothiol-dependent enzyme n=1 Tax=Streptomyces koelreuteriae TaxID=2838015 RepID=A0ABX8FJR4_9ACTN|nr:MULTISPECIES: maleylpyruvate isomerase family mycothiol-dependent enzyme [Streptomyces]QWB21352.1 maleylpyruvate isomerase family mycothiol-dependent enzyme [Streptomyces koelreuteriae]UUA04270.1 maleylpyruvate isomerase family mycothiol-dependent enzyme [Streptomyces koelreuteriae]UUA11895.1 maleylpyruvate isomerase family mycothiol-dependent enzyme [Streptomyces sp. CRCS-T-1]